MKNQVANTVAKTLVGLTPEQIVAKRQAKKEATRRFRARQSYLSTGRIPTADLVVRSMQPKALSTEKMRMILPDGTIVRANKNGGEKVALCFSHPDGTKSRKSFANIKLASKAFRELVK